MSAVFPKLQIQHITSVIGGGTPGASNENWDGDVPFATPVDLNSLDGQTLSATQRSLTPKGLSSGSSSIDVGVLVSCRAPIGAIGTVETVTSFNQGCKGLPMSSKRDSRFLAYALIAARGEMSALGNGTTFQEISGGALSRMLVPWPDAHDRSAIAAFLDRETDEMDAMVTNLDQLIATLRERRGNVVSVSIWNDANDFGTAPLFALAGAEGMLVDGDWVESKDQDPDGNIRLLQLADIGSGTFLNKSDRWINEEAFNRLSCTDVLPGDVLIARMPEPIARATVVPDGLGRCITVVDVAILRIGSSTDPRYAAYVLNSDPLRESVESKLVGSTRQRIARSRLAAERVPLRPLAEQQRIADHLDRETAEIDAMIARTEELKARIAERRSALITDVVNGRKEIH